MNEYKIYFFKEKNNERTDDFLFIKIKEKCLVTIKKLLFILNRLFYSSATPT